MDEKAKEVFNMELDRVLSRCTAFQVGGNAAYCYSYVDVCIQLELCVVCAGQVIHDDLQMASVETKAGQFTPIIVVGLQAIYKLIASISTPSTRYLLDLFSNIHINLPKSEQSSDLGDLLGGLGELN